MLFLKMFISPLLQNATSWYQNVLISCKFSSPVLSDESVVKNYHYVDSAKMPTPSIICIPALFSLSLTRALHTYPKRQSSSAIFVSVGARRWSTLRYNSEHESLSRRGCIRPPVRPGPRSDVSLPSGSGHKKILNGTSAILTLEMTPQDNLTTSTR